MNLSYGLGVVRVASDCYLGTSKEDRIDGVEHLPRLDVDSRATLRRKASSRPSGQRSHDEVGVAHRKVVSEPVVPQ